MPTSFRNPISRRYFLRECGYGTGKIALAALLTGALSAKVADDICLVKSMHTDQFNHAPAQIFLNTGAAQPGRPSLGSWVIYGLGAETENLPAFIVMSTGSGVSGGASNWSNGFMPNIYA